MAVAVAEESQVLVVVVRSEEKAVRATSAVREKGKSHDRSGAGADLPVHVLYL